MRQDASVVATHAMEDAFQARIWYVIEPAEDVPGEWVGHCLDFDVVTQGRDLPHTFGMLNEAVSMVVVDDLDAEREPRSRRAPEEFRQRLSKMLDHAEKRSEAGPFPPEPSPGAVYIYEVMNTIPAHNGERTEIGDQYLRGACRAFGIEYEQVRGSLR